MFSEYLFPVPDLYKIYIDDVFGVASDEEHDLISFINFVSSYHHAIKYIFNITRESLSFLAPIVKSKEVNFYTSYKSMDVHFY